MTRLGVVICTYNRAVSLGATLESLYAGYAGTEAVDVRVVVNACTDDTLAILADSRARHAGSPLNLAWVEESVPGKSHALNTALREYKNEALCFIDDDQSTEAGFLEAILDALTSHPEDDIFCGRLWPAWDGSEPSWVHAAEPWAIPIRPFPEYDLGAESFRLPHDHRLPSGGNITVRRRVFDGIGGFATDLGPRGHDLSGGEDHDFLSRAVAAGFHIRYLPAARQLHAIDAQRMGKVYLLKKSFSRSRSNFLIKGGGGPRPYMLRKIVGHGLRSALSLDSNRRFFYAVRLAASFGELIGSIAGIMDRRPHGRGSRIFIGDSVSHGLQAQGFMAVVFGLLAFLDLPVATTALPVLAAAALTSAILAARSLLHFSRTGPRLRQEILSRYRAYTAYAFLRLSLFAFAVALLSGAAGAAIYGQLNVVLGESWSSNVAFAAALTAIGLATAWRLVVKLVGNPGLVIASTHYRPSRLYPIWRLLTPARLQTVRVGGLAALLFLAGLATHRLALDNDPGGLVALWSGGLFYVCLIRWTENCPEGPGKPVRSPSSQYPNIIMLGSDTLRADILGRGLTPHLDELARQGTWFSQCYVPCARTAPSLVSILTGQWPTSHGIRDNFVSDEETRTSFDALPRWLGSLGYRSAAISDWCGADLGKLDLGFDLLDVPEDQWNLKYLIRQGPKDLRLFLSLFLHNRAGRLFLPEIYYQGGVPLTDQLGPRARRLAARLGENGRPFLLNVFYSTTHPPFASEWPWYTRYADPAYAGESKFAMARLTDPMDVLRRQGEPREEFDLEQILHLYDGCVAQFDYEVGLMLDQLAQSGLAQNTILAIYSDHGMEFFEHDTWGQGNSAVGEASPRIPFILHDPRRPGGGRVDQVVRSIDLAPTLAELAGAPPPTSPDGRSLVPLLTTPTPGLDMALPAYNETGLWLTAMPGQSPDHLRYPDLLELMEVPDHASGTLALKEEYRRAILAAKDRMLRAGPWKLVYQPMQSGCRLLLFDLERDPACTHDLAAENPDVVAHLWGRLQAWLDADGVPIRKACSPNAEAAGSPA